MITIYKYTLKHTRTQTIALPEGSRLLCVQIQHKSQIQLWAHVDTAAPPRQCTITMIGTGHPIEGEPGAFLGTVQLQDGLLVEHVFARWMTK